MAQHYPIETFKQKAMRKIENSIRNERYMGGSLKYERMERIVGRHNIDDYKETPDDEVFETTRAVPKSIVWFKPTFEVHTKPSPDGRGRIVTNIYLVA